MKEARKSITPEVASQIYGVNVGTLANLRSQRRGPKYYKVGRRVVYKVEDFEKWLTSEPVLTHEDIFRLKGLVDEIYMDTKIEEYIVNLVDATRNPEAYGLSIGNYIQYGASPRGTLYLTLASKAMALLNGRGYTTPQDVKSIGMDVLRHRLIISYEAEAEEKTSETLLEEILSTIEVP